MFLRIPLLLAVMLISVGVSAQEYKFGKVPIEVLEDSTYEPDSMAAAVVLFNNRETYFNYEHPEGWLVYTDVHERIKILNKDGLDYGTSKFRIYQNGGDKERIVKIKGLTFNLEGGKVESEKLRNNGIFETDLRKNWKEVTITMPDVKQGSVIDLKYTLISPFYEIEDLVIQQDIPVAHYFASIRTPGYFKYKRTVKGNVSIKPKDYVRRRNMNMTFEASASDAQTAPTMSSTVQIEETVNEYDFRSIPALKEEPYVDNIDNYRFEVTYELSEVEEPNGQKKSFSTTWEKVAKNIYESKYFGGQLDRKGYLKDEVERINSEQQGAINKMNAAFNTLKKHMRWDGNFSKYSENIASAYKERTGTSGDINLMLVALCRELGLNSNPVLLSTREHGIPAFATQDGFNHVIACVDINNERYLLDATEIMSVPNLLPSRDLNWYGTLVMESGISKQINLYPETTSQFNTMLSVEINEDGSIEGKQRSNYTLLEALSYRMRNNAVSQQTKEEYLIDNYGLTEVENLEEKDFQDLSKPVTSSFEFYAEDAIEMIGDEMYISPLMFLRLAANPFTQEERNFPVDYKYPFAHKKIVSIKVPEGFQVTSMPESMSLSMPDGMGAFKFRISESNGTISLRSSFEMNRSVIPAFKYPELREFYKQRVEKENEKVVLTRI